MVDSTPSTEKKRKSSRQYRLLLRQHKLLDQLLTKQHQLYEQQLTKQHQLYEQLLDKQNTLNLLLLKQCKLMFQSGGAAAAPAQPSVDALVHELLAQEGVDRADVKEQAGESLVPAAPAPVIPEKPMPAKPKPKPKAKKVDDDAEPRVPIKYRITLASLAAILILYLGVSYWQSPSSVKSLARQALSAGTMEERLRAANELRARQANTELRHVAAETKDTEVLLLAVNYLWGASDGASAPVFYVAMKHEDKDVREAGLRGAQKLYGEILPGKIEYQVDDPPQQREQAVTKLLDFYNNPPKMPMSRQ